MKSKYFSITGVLSQKNYFKMVALVFAEILVVSAALLYFMDLLDAEVAGAPIINQNVAIALFVIMSLNILMAYISLLSIVMRRSRDAGNAILWTCLTLLNPFGIVLLGFVAKNRT